MNIKHIFRYPIKGLSPESLNAVLLSTGAGIPLDRAFAITHGNSKFNFEQPEWISRGNFVVVAKSPNLATVQSHYDSCLERLEIAHGNQPKQQFNLSDESEQKRLSDYLTDFIGKHQPGPYRIAEVVDTSLTDSPEKAVSIMNLSSLKELEGLANSSLAKSRFRGNFWFDGENSWQEFDWIDKEITIGKVRLKVVERIQRCAAVNANPETGLRDVNLIKVLHNNFGHTDFGVLAKIINDGSLTVEDTVKLA
jgi:uncharacterized protein YcbX